jgi:hypothetical protein
MYINTASINVDTYGTPFISCPAFSKVLHIHVKHNQLVITYSSEQMINTYNNVSDGTFKTFQFKVLKGLHQNNTHIMMGFEYFNTIRISEDDMVEYYHIFINEIKSLAEQRDNKIGEVISSDHH